MVGAIIHAVNAFVILLVGIYAVGQVRKQHKDIMSLSRAIHLLAEDLNITKENVKTLRVIIQKRSEQTQELIDKLGRSKNAKRK